MFSALVVLGAASHIEFVHMPSVSSKSKLNFPQAGNIELSDVVHDLEQYLSVPKTINYSQFPPSVVKALCDDCSVLSCGCLISEKLANELSTHSKEFVCPQCHNTDVYLLNVCTTIRSLVKYVHGLKDLLVYEKDSNSENAKESSVSEHEYQQKQHKVTFLSAFNEVFAEINSGSRIEDYKKDGYNSMNTQSSSYSSREHGRHSNGSISYKDRRLQGEQQAQQSIASTSPGSNFTPSSLHSLSRQRTRNSFPTSNLTKLLTSSSNNDKAGLKKNQGRPQSMDASKELIYGKNFPFFRKLFQYRLHHSKFFPRSKLFIGTSISPDLKHLALLTERKFEVYSLDPDKPDQCPKLYCCGKNNGEYGSDYSDHHVISDEEVVRNSNFTESPGLALEGLTKWEHHSCKISKNILVIAGSRGFLRIHDLSFRGRCIFTYQCKFPIRCMDMSPDGRFISIGITGKDKYTLVEQAFVILLRLDFDDSADIASANVSLTSSNKAIYTLFHSAEDHANNGKSNSTNTLSTFQTSHGVHVGLRLIAFPFNLPYRDPINILQFSPNSKMLSVATALESRFLTINITDPNRPILVMKSQRRMDTSLDSEGITDMQFFPDDRIMCITSVASNSMPIVIDTNISSISGPNGIAKPKMLLKVSEVGSTIHKCCVSPRGDAVAYLDRSGTVYIMMCPRMDDSDNKRIVVVTDVANSFTVGESASMRFDSHGYKLYIIDRKGILTISDFTAGTVEDQSVTRCKIIT